MTRSTDHILDSLEFPSQRTEVNLELGSVATLATLLSAQNKLRDEDLANFDRDEYMSRIPHTD